MTTNRIILLVTIIGTIIILSHHREKKQSTNDVYFESNTENFNTSFRSVYESKLPFYWLMESVYMREYIVRSAYRLTNQQEIIERLKKNVSQISNTLGSTAFLNYLFSNHIDLFIKVVTSIITSDGENYDKFSFAWAKNGALISSELSKHNSKYSYDTLKKIWMAYFVAIESEIRSIQKQQSGLEMFDNVTKISGHLANYLSKN